MVGFLLSLTFGCGLVVAGAHVVNRRFVAPVYDVVANLTAFAGAVAASTLLHHWVSAALAALAVCCWLCLARRTLRAIRHREPRRGQAPPPTRPGSVRPAPVVPQQYGRESG